MFRTRLSAVAAVAGVLFAGPAAALPYMLETASSSITGPLGGGFQYDPASETYGAAAVTAGGRNWFNVVGGDSQRLRLTEAPAADLSGALVFELSFADALNADGLLTGLTRSLEGVCIDVGCGFAAFPQVIETHSGGVRGEALPPRRWFFRDASAQGVGTVEGDFVFDGRTGEFSDISVIANGTLYDQIVPGSTPDDFSVAVGLEDGDSLLRIATTDPLSNLGRPTPFDDIRLGVCLSDCTFQVLVQAVSFPQGDLASRRLSGGGGGSSGAEVPLPGAAGLLLAGLGGLCALRRRRA